MKSLPLLIGLVALIATGLWVSAPTNAVGFDPTHRCADCHGSHGLQGGTLIKGHTVDALCLGCHGPGGQSRLQVIAHHSSFPTTAAEQGKRCTQCHSLHGETPSFPPGPLQVVPMGRPPGW